MLYYCESDLWFFRILHKLRSSDRFVGGYVNPCKEKASRVLNRVAMILVINAIAIRFGSFSEMFSLGLQHGFLKYLMDILEKIMVSLVIAVSPLRDLEVKITGEKQ